MFKAILTFDRLSKVLVIGGVGLFTLGLAIAFLKSRRADDTDGAVLLICVIFTLVALAMVGVLTCSEANVRAFGLGFQVIGILVALYALQDVRIKLDQPGLIAAFTDIIERPFKTPHNNGEGAILEGSDSSSSKAHRTLATHPKSLSAEDRLTVLEDQVANLEARHASDIAAMRSAMKDSQQNELERHRGQVAAVKDIKQLVVKIQTDGLPLALFGLLWLLIGAVLTSLPIEVAGWIKYFHN
jgi:hypothetical protein